MTSKRNIATKAAFALGLSALAVQVMAEHGLHSQDLEVAHAGIQGPLKGTLLKADDEGAPAVLILPGSGPTDRDGNNPMGVNAATYRLLAEALAAEGVSSLRIDKRGMFGSSAAIADANDVTIEAYVDDTAAWVEELAQQTADDCVWLLGHSEGGVIALASVASEMGQVCGVVLAASPGRPMGDLLREQLRANPANEPLLEQAEAAIDALEAGESVDPTGLHPALQPLFNAQVQGFLKSLMALDPAALAAGYNGPLLIVQPSEDLQVSMSDAEALHAANSASKLVVLDGVNHVLKAVPAGDRMANLQSYANPDLPLADGVSEAIATFVKKPR